MDTFTLEAGRAIRRNGAPFVSIAGCSRESPGYAPADFDTFARFAVAAVDALRECVTDAGARCLNDDKRGEGARRRLMAINGIAMTALALLPLPEAPALPVDAAPPLCSCDNCPWEGPESALGRSLHQIHHLAERLDPGSEVPAGECPECGALAYIIGED